VTRVLSERENFSPDGRALRQQFYKKPASHQKHGEGGQTP
jgi:hypothetical protein